MTSVTAVYIVSQRKNKYDVCDSCLQNIIEEEEV